MDRDEMKVLVLREPCENPEDEEWVEFYPPLLPCRLYGLEAVRVRGRLMSTRGGVAYNWFANFDLPSGARYRPRVHLEFRDDVILWAPGYRGRLDSVTEPDPGHVMLAWLGKDVFQPVVISARSVKDLTFRAERQRLFEHVRALPVVESLTQGHLTMQRLAVDPLWRDAIWRMMKELGFTQEQVGHMLIWPDGPVVLFNHALFAQGLVGLDNMRLVEIWVDEQVTSPDHPFEPVTVTPGVWLFSHPWPAGGGDAD